MGFIYIIVALILSVILYTMIDVWYIKPAKSLEKKFDILAEKSTALVVKRTNEKYEEIRKTQKLQTQYNKLKVRYENLYKKYKKLRASLKNSSVPTTTTSVEDIKPKSIRSGKKKLLEKFNPKKN